MISSSYNLFKTQSVDSVSGHKPKLVFMYIAGLLTMENYK